MGNVDFSAPQAAGSIGLTEPTGVCTIPYAGGSVVLSAPLVGALTLTTSSGAITVVPPGTSGAHPLPDADGAPNTSWRYANNADLGKALLMLATPQHLSPHPRTES